MLLNQRTREIRHTKHIQQVLMRQQLIQATLRLHMKRQHTRATQQCPVIQLLHMKRQHTRATQQCPVIQLLHMRPRLIQTMRQYNMTQLRIIQLIRLLRT